MLTPEIMMHAYAKGMFPMAEDANSEELYWFDPHKRAILPLTSFHVAKKMRRWIKTCPFEVKINTNFEGVIDGCATSRENTWINKTIRDIFIELHLQKKAHSIEAWENGVLVGGLYGAALGGAFFGESMFSKKSNASKVCLIHLVERLRKRDFTVLDVQFTNPHLEQFGVIEIPRETYHQLLTESVNRPISFI